MSDQPQPPPQPRKIKGHRARRRFEQGEARPPQSDASPDVGASSSTGPETAAAPAAPPQDETKTPQQQPPPLFLSKTDKLFSPLLGNHGKPIPNYFGTGSATLSAEDFKQQYDQEIVRRTTAEVQRDEERKLKETAERQLGELAVHTEGLESRIRRVEFEREVLEHKLKQNQNVIQLHEATARSHVSTLEQEKAARTQAEWERGQVAMQAEADQLELESLRESSKQREAEYDRRIADHEAKLAEQALKIKEYEKALQVAEGERQHSNVLYDEQLSHVKEVEDANQELGQKELRNLGQISEQGAEIKRLTERLEDRERAVDEANKEVVRVQEEQTQQQANHDHDRQQLHIEQARCAELKKEFEILLGDLDQARAQWTEEKEKNIELTERLEQADAKQDELASDNAYLEVELGKFVSHSNELDEHITDVARHTAAMAEKDEDINRMHKLLNYCRERHGGELPDPDDLPEVVGPMLPEQSPTSPSKHSVRSDLQEELGGEDSSDDGAEVDYRSLAPIHTIIDQPEHTVPLTKGSIHTILDQPDGVLPLSLGPIYTIIDQVDQTEAVPMFTRAAVHEVHEEAPQRPAPAPPRSRGSVHTIIDMEPFSVPAGATTIRSKGARSVRTAVSTMIDEPPRRASLLPVAHAHGTKAEPLSPPLSWLSVLSVLLVLVLAVAQTGLAWRERWTWLGANEDSQRLLWSMLGSGADGTRGLGAMMGNALGTVLGLSEFDMAEARALLH